MTSPKYFLLALTLLALAIAPTFASAQSYITTLYNTGVDDNGNLLNSGAPNGAVDPHYTVLSGPAALYGVNFTGGLAYTTVPKSGWWTDPFVAEWINPINNGAGAPANASKGSYDYQTSFYLKEDCIDLTKQQVYLVGQFAADDSACIWVNGVNTGVCTTGGFTSPTFFKIKGPSATAPFVVGTNRLDFIVQNSGDNSPTGLIVEVIGSVN